MNPELMLYRSSEEFEGGILRTEDFNLVADLPLPDSLPDLNFEVEQHLCDLPGPDLANRGPPDRVPFAGKYDFVVEINSSHTHKKKYVFSHKLNRIYVDIEVDFPVQFNWRGPASMYVRATCVFADEAQAQKRVQRCLQHFHQSTDTEEVAALNVLQSSRPGGTAGVRYCGAAAPDAWLSVLVALGKPGAEPAPHAYRFACKNSCTSGINRRAILIIFTLEDHTGVVHGRQIVGARVCACPRRDMLKDEESEGAPRGGKRRAAPAQTDPAPPTKVKREDLAGDAVIDLSLLNPQAAILGLEVMIKMHEQSDEAMREPRNRELVAHLKQVQDNLKSKHPQE